MDRNSKDIAHHDDVAAQYDDIVVNPRSESNRVLFARFETALATLRRDRMLDLGCGTGQMLLRFGGGFHSVTGVDHSEKMLAVAEASARRAGIRAGFVRSDLLEFLAKHEQRYDLVTCVGCLHHLDAEGQAAVIAALPKLLEPRSGIALIADPIAGADPEPPEIAKWNARKVERPLWYSVPVSAEPDEAPIDLAALRIAIAKAGLRVVKQVLAWDLVSGSLAPGFFERLKIRRLANKYPGGNVIALALASDAG